MDGVLVDVKSASSFQMQKFKEGIAKDNDPFGYRTQLYSYATALGVNKAAFIAVDKQHGHVVVDEHEIPEETQEKVRQFLRSRKEIVEKDVPPPRAYEDIPDGKSGNRKLGLNCSYCSYKQHCWPGLRTFLSSRGPVFLTKVIREPKMAEKKNDD